MGLRAFLVDVEKLRSEETSQMFLLMNRYYHGMTEENFHSDLRNKSKVFMLRCSQGKIQGFSTILIREFSENNRKWTGIFSGDTIVEKDYWGNPALQVAFSRYLVKVKCARLTTPVYWFLISKGYKTYLLLAKNFLTYFPRYDRKTPLNYKKKMDHFYNYLFEEKYDAVAGIIRPSDGVSLKSDIAPISMEELKDPRIAFFANNNPQWEVGVELACLGEVSLMTPILHILKKCFLFRKKKFPSTKWIPKEV